ncbi:ABC-type antimicrobial peptide transport system, permease component [Mucilaginibacter lappiensis]|uniref:ABC-type antimicrobial peptide transport system permease subunit n=1 Tax=Mucilaginibacter lappiensis TaxID=354630 RepID=A0ABR6PHY7_9SPHI|nr:ABC transporter permease [Mucilaginibacter lappiensis]MBB6109372.1 ABC-type antimicrobial peptide transport system permease subunit [Mucilaginibacter lappiensis]SIQ98084.1 ABC-type antimicrobial peptide transport system, permease component [Mucilaginibacter lappiensis]
MIKNYFKIALRNFSKHKLFTLINIIGLSIGISSALVIYLIVHFDFTFNQSFTDGDRIYRIVSNYTFSGQEAHNRGVTGALPEAMKSVSGVAISAPFFTLNQPNVLIPSKSGVPVKFKIQDNVVLADSHYFNLFNYSWRAGSAKTALNEPNQVVLTTDQAKKYFPSLSYNQMLGRTVTYDTLTTTVSGIVEPLKGNNDFTFHDFISHASINSNKALLNEIRPKNWGGTTSASQLFIKLSPNITVAHIEKQLNELLKKNNPPKPSDKGNTRNFTLQPLSDLHFNGIYGTFDTGASRSANKTTLYGLLVIALFLLLLGCINFVNLTTAQATQRAKEIGIRKTMGSSRVQLIIQFLSETFLITLIAVIVSVAMAPVILKLFADFIPEGIKVDILGHPDLIIFLFLLTIMVSLLSGFYPAVLLSGYKPALVLKNQTAANSNKTRNAMLRKSLTVLQFVIAQFFIMATILVSKQIYYALHKDLGFKKDAIIVINSPWKNRTASRNQVFMNKLKAIPQIEMIAVGKDAPSSSSSNSTEATYKDGKKDIKINLEEKYGDENYINVYKIKLLAGRNLRLADTSRGFLINTTCAKIFGFKNPKDAVGKLIDNFNGDTKMEIIGVVADFYHESLHSPIRPLAILTSKERYNNGTFHIALKPQSAGGNDWKKAISAMESAWKEIYPEDDFEYHFFDENIAKFYDAEQHTSTLLTWATGLSVFISCLGLLGLAMYTTNLRTKEIGVRKVLGASVTQIVTLLSTELIILIVLAFALVTPLAWYAMHKWMESFADRTTISWWIFVLSGAGMLLAALCTLSFQTVKAAITNPVKSLRSE